MKAYNHAHCLPVASLGGGGEVVEHLLHHLLLLLLLDLLHHAKHRMQLCQQNKISELNVNCESSLDVFVKLFMRTSEGQHRTHQAKML